MPSLRLFFPMEYRIGFSLSSGFTNLTRKLYHNLHLPTTPFLQVWLLAHNYPESSCEIDGKGYKIVLALENNWISFPIFLLLYLCFSQYIAIFILSRLWARKSSGRASAALHPNILFIYRSIPAHLRTKSLCGVAKLREMAYNVSARKGASHILFARRENKWTQLVEVWAFYLEPHTRRASCGPLAFASFL